MAICQATARLLCMAFSTALPPLPPRWCFAPCSRVRPPIFVSRYLRRAIAANSNCTSFLATRSRLTDVSRVDVSSARSFAIADKISLDDENVTIVDDRICVERYGCISYFRHNCRIEILCVNYALLVCLDCVISNVCRVLGAFGAFRKFAM